MHSVARTGLNKHSYGAKKLQLLATFATCLQCVEVTSFRAHLVGISCLLLVLWLVQLSHGLAVNTSKPSNETSRQGKCKPTFLYLRFSLDFLYSATNLIRSFVYSAL